MKKFEVQINDELDLRIVRIVEPVTFDDLIGLATQDFGRVIRQNLIWEFAPGTLQFLDVESIKGNLDMRRREHEQRAGGHTVMVAHDPSEEMLIKWYKSFAEALPFHDVQFHVCASMDEAMEIIRAD